MLHHRPTRVLVQLSRARTSRRCARINGIHSHSYQQGNVPLVINGQDVTTSESFEVISPLTGKPIWRTATASKQEVLDAVETAQSVFPAWSKTKPHERRDIFLRASDLMVKRREELGEYMHQEIGANRQYQDFILGLSIEGLRDTAGRIAGAMQGQVPVSMHPGMNSIIHKRPYGVILGIAPWNAPYHLGLRSITFALAAGNTAILKGPELSPKCYWAFVDVFREAGLPDGTLNLLFHRPADAGPVTEMLISHPHVKKINFTGSTKVGSIISATAGKHLKPVLMELGGKANAIVLKDADIEKAALHCANGAFLNAGQICMSTERILVHSSIASKFESVLKETTSRLFGSPETTPVVVTSASAKRNRELVASAVSQGAQILSGTTDIVHDTDTRISPIVVSNVDKSMGLYGTESFGPSVSLYTFETVEEAVALANDTEYGLAASIFTENLAEAFQLAELLDSGAVHINSMTIHDEFALPHGGVKKSGFGRFNGYQGLDEFLYCKTVTWMQ
ncbi:putative aldehyde dehydrogenase [Talaromyces proteolyticus]|uniref:Aldehyde dehydrogenase n=1 Tax=Talaromyces proteolyticus TaxID=1131652 RepID=A0AAD4KWX0_9EURO|nr:putative aldehyde dehydrogenase [Talaromyces proteolyticus]KAH8703030.1 putative aldehyde dehydrogenase [Talaromyces proteolyticus]